MIRRVNTVSLSDASSKIPYDIKMKVPRDHGARHFIALWSRDYALAVALATLVGETTEGDGATGTALGVGA